MQAGYENVSFDSAASSDDGTIVSRRWTIEGHAHGGGLRLSLDLPPRPTSYSVRLVVTDEDHQSDSAQLHLARLPASPFGFDREEPENGKAIERIGKSLVKTLRDEMPTAVELDGHTDDVGSTAYNLGLSLRRIEAVRKELLTDAPPASGVGTASSVPVALRAFGESCPLDRHHGRSQVNRRVEVFILGPGTTLAPRPGCHAGRKESTRWQPPSAP
jgi:outer membrane protein OmpA-like peptidoglycan-associated protein